MALTKIGADGVKDDAITPDKIPANAIGSSEIADTAVTLAKLEHGTSSNDGKFLRANNGADPTFESIPAAAIASIANDGANRVLTSDGDGTATAETNLRYDGTNFLIGTDTEAPYNNRNLTVAAGSSGSTTVAIEVRSPSAGSGRVIFSDGTTADAAANQGQVIYDHQNEKLLLGVAANYQNVAVESTGGTGADLNIIDGNLKFASGHGIDFSASSNESGSTDELLADYERGSFTGEWYFSPTNASSVTYTYQGGMYVKVGRMVYFTLHMWTSSKGTLSSGSGWCQISGLPFAVDAEGGFACVAYYDNFGSFNPSVARVTPSERIYIAQHNSGGYSQDLQHSHMNNTTRMHIGGCYATTS